MRMEQGYWLILMGLLAVLAGPARADEKKPDATPQPRQALDRQLAEVLKDVHNRGADLYNSGDVAGCYRLFQGALLTLRPLLDHRAELQKTIDGALAESERNPDMRRRAFALHRLIEDVRSQLKTVREER